ncbi:MAG: SDR family oxidoreductase, partial [Pseudomonadota bacterium]
MTDLHGRVALVTGASRGLGAAIAARLASQGAQVVLTARTVGGLEATDDAVRAAGGADAVIAPADLADPLAVASLVAAVYERFRRLDFVVSAAAFTSPLTPIAHQRPEDWVTSIAVNLTAPFQLMRNAEPLLRQSGGAALFITCKEGQVPRPYYGAYA